MNAAVSLARWAWTSPVLLFLVTFTIWAAYTNPQSGHADTIRDLTRIQACLEHRLCVTTEHFAPYGLNHGRHWQQVLMLQGKMGWSFETLSWLLVLLNSLGVLVVALTSRIVFGARLNLLLALLWGALSLETSMVFQLWNPNLTALPLACFWGALLVAFKRPGQVWLELLWLGLAGAVLGMASGLHSIYFLGLPLIVFVAFSSSRFPLTSTVTALFFFGVVWEVLSPGSLAIILSAPVVQGGGVLAVLVVPLIAGVAFRWLQRFLADGTAALLLVAVAAVTFSLGLHMALTAAHVSPVSRYFGMFVTPLVLSFPLLERLAQRLPIPEQPRIWLVHLVSAALVLKVVCLVPVLKGPPWDHSLLSLDDASEISRTLYEQGFSYDALSLNTLLCDSGATAEIFGMFEPAAQSERRGLPQDSRMVILKLPEVLLPTVTPDNWRVIPLKRNYAAVVATFPSMVRTDDVEICVGISGDGSAGTCHRTSYALTYPLEFRALANDPGRRLWQFMEQEDENAGRKETSGPPQNDLQLSYRFNLLETMPAGNYTLLSGLTMGQVRLRDDSDATTIRLDVDHFNAEWPLVFALIPADDPLLQYRDILRPCTPQPFLLSRPDPP